MNETIIFGIGLFSGIFSYIIISFINKKLGIGGNQNGK